MALLGDLQTKENASTPAKVYSPENDGTTIQGIGSAASPFAVKDGGITNAKLANMATKRYKGRTTAGTGAPEDLTAAQMQADLSVDDLVTLSGVAEGAVNLGTFTGSTIAGNRTIKQALQDLETELETVSGITVVRATTTSGVNANNQVRVAYVVLTSSPTVTVTWSGEGGTSPSVTINASGGTIRVVSVFSTYENTNAAAANLDIIVNGVGANEIDAIPMVQKILHNQAFSAASPAANCAYDQDNTPSLNPYAYSSASMGTIKVRLTNQPAGDRYVVKMLWHEN